MNIEDKEFMGKYILNNPFEFKQGIISHCREMDKIDVYNWVAEDELKIDKLQQENKNLNGAIQTYDILLKSNTEENKQLKDNWNYIKKMLKEVRQEKFNVNGYCGTCTDVDIDFLLNKMQELEGSDSNE
jgi:hypothetical protein|nr:MAG TPA: hypothetical protein [Caudoviricetes sp.]